MKITKMLLMVAIMFVTSIVTAVTLDAPITMELSEGGVRTYLVEDFSGGGVNDLMLTNLKGRVHVYLGENPEEGLFSDSRDIPQTSQLYNNLPVNALASADFNNDGMLDVVLGPYFCDNSEIHFAVMINTGKARFAPAPCIGPDSVSFTYLETGVIAIATGDLNSDGNTDIVLSTSGRVKAVFAYFGNGDGTFSEKLTIYDPKLYNFIPKKVSIMDIDQNGTNDIVIQATYFASSEWREPVVLSGNGAGDFIVINWTQAIPTEISEYPLVQAKVDTWSTDHPVDAHIVDDFTGNGLGDVITLSTEDWKGVTFANLFVQAGAPVVDAVVVEPIEVQEIEPVEVEEVEPTEIEEIEPIEVEE